MAEDPVVLCPSGHSTPVGESSAVCSTCGHKLSKMCGNGHLSPVTSRFCPICGDALQSPDALAPNVTNPASIALVGDQNPQLPGLSARHIGSAIRVRADVPVATLEGAATTPRRKWAIACGGVLALVLLIGMTAMVVGGDRKGPKNLAPPSSHTTTGARTDTGSHERTTIVTPSTLGNPESPGSTGMTTTTNVSAAGHAGTPLTTTDLTAEGTSAMGVVQSLATALADHDWDQARSIFSGLSQSDEQLQSEYGGLNESTVVVTGEIDGGNDTVDLTGAYVAWETVKGNQQTSIYCITWAVDPGDHEVINQSSAGSNNEDYQSGWVDPQSLESAVTGVC